MKVDRRRRQWVPLSATFAHGGTGVKLKAKFGRDGLLVWICYLAACKRNWIQGQFTYVSESEGWRDLGLGGLEPEFTLKAFFDATGRMKLTSRRRVGDTTDVVCTRWAEWNDEIRRDIDAERKRSKRGTNTQTLGGSSDDDGETIRGTESDVDVESEETPQTPLSMNGSKYVCECGVEKRTEALLIEHRENVHGIAA